MVQLHIIVNAREGAVAYFWITNDNGVEWSLVAAKTNVAPTEVNSIPRLEIQAATLTLTQKLHKKNK